MTNPEINNQQSSSSHAAFRTTNPRSTSKAGGLSHFFKRVSSVLKYKKRCYYYQLKYRIQFKPDKHILVAGFPTSRNFGDALNGYLIEFLSGKKVFPSLLVKKKKDPVYAVVGSILHWVDDGAVIWGSGLISDQVKASQSLTIKAVRGPLTRKALIAQGQTNCPEVYGDPALLMPLIYHPERRPVYQYGIIPHYSDKKHPALNDLTHLGSTLLIDVQTGSNVLPFIDQILSCKTIVTSSLHGMILAHAYGIPCVWVKFFGNLLGGEFKFYDHLQAVRKNSIEPISVDETIDPNVLREYLDDQPIVWDPAPLIESCPFLLEEVKSQLYSKSSRNERSN